jgi:hypothetical protein
VTRLFSSFVLFLRLGRGGKKKGQDTQKQYRLFVGPVYWARNMSVVCSISIFHDPGKKHFLALPVENSNTL